ncbi:DEAD/DEAH box helicase [Sulfitobacter sp. F26169L]|nr:DEAD/DEAH box helicase [Sulfitobacter sp. F26169L]
MSDRPPVWDETIRGARDGYNPAYEFIESIVPLELGPWAFIQALLVPEYPLFRRLGAPSNLIDGPNDEQVDFYLPQADLVIEIDGGQHGEQRQAWKDRARDRFLEKLGIVTLRLKTEDLRKRNADFVSFIASLRDRCDASTRLKAYRKFTADRQAAAPSLRFDLTAVIRLQIAIMLAISHRQLDLNQPEWRLNISQDFATRSEHNWAASAIEELFDWFGLFARLNYTEFTPPEIKFDNTGLHFDMRLFSRADDETCRVEGIVICTGAVQDHPFTITPGRKARLRNFGVSYLATEDTTELSDTPPSVADLTELSRRVFGHENFRPGQDTLILNAISGQKSLGLMPTGGGKSLCFQVPALLGPGTAIVVVPIKALGRDHVAELEAAGFSGRVVNIDGDMPARLRDEVYGERILRGEMRFVFVSPERFQTEKFRHIVRRLREKDRLRMFVIDEVHCMSEWGHDFRPSYLTLPGTLRSLADDVPVLGLTATASVNVLRDIQSEFQIPDELVAYEMHRSRTELNFSIRKELSTPEQVAREINRIFTKTEGNAPPQVHIFSRYVNGPAGVERLSTMLANAGLGLRVGLFSGSAPKTFDVEKAFERLRNPNLPIPKTFEDYKQTVQNLWKSGHLDTIVTTKAFGMGVNKPDVRHTLHAGMPGSMEAFYQEAGRAGRDREHADCHMLFRPEEDEAEQIYLRLSANLNPNAIKAELEGKDGGRKPVRGDFRSQLWFLAQGLISQEEELALVARLHEIVRNCTTETLMIRAGQMGDVAHSGQRFQITLYRLYQMGLITPWAVTDWGRGAGDDLSVQAVEVRRLNTSFADACTAIISRIQAVDGKGAESATVEHLNALKTGRDNWTELYRQLLNWVRRKQLGSRLESTWNLYRESHAFTPERAVEFREGLEAFFKVDSNAFQLAALRDMSIDEVTAVISDLITLPGQQMLKDHSALRKLSAQLSRLLEGTQESPGLNLASAFLHLITERTPGSEATMRFRAAVPKGALFLWNGPGRDLLAKVASSSTAASDIIGAWLVEGKPERQQLLEIHEAIPARSVEAALLNEMASELALAI